MIKIKNMIDFAFLDSGTGGLPYLKYLIQKSPDSNCVYIGDTINFPYGQKSKEEIIKNSCDCVKKIIQKWNPCVIVVACNTISVTALEDLRKNFPNTKFVGTVPAIKPASLISKNKKIGILATNATINNPYTKKLQKDFASDCQIVNRADPELIAFIEHEFFNASEENRINAVKPAIDFFYNQNCDVIVLACTHFLNMIEYFKIAAKDKIYVVDSREGVAKHAIELHNEILQNQKNCKENQNLTKNNVKCELYVTGFTTSNDSNAYQTFSKNNGIIFGGVLK